MQGKSRVVLNISGEIYETYDETLRRFPKTLLGAKNKRRKHYCSITDQHIFHCNRLCFGAILYFYQSCGTLNCPQGIPINVFETECQYFELPEDSINNMKRREGIIFDLDSDDNCSNQLSFQLKIYDMLENPESSLAGWTFGIFSLVITWVSIVTATLDTIPELDGVDGVKVACDHLCLVEIVMNSWFLLELVLRFIFSQDKVGFFKATINWVDIIAIIPYFIILGLNPQTKGISFIGILKTLRYIRVVKLFRFSKHSRRLKVVGIILKSSLGNFRLLMLCLVMLIFVGGTFMYFVESVASHTAFTSIPQSLWWAVQTITSVGYGDIIPITFVGRLFACCFMLFGAVTISLPVLTIVSQFTTLYPRNVEYDSYTDD